MDIKVDCVIVLWLRVSDNRNEVCLRSRGRNLYEPFHTILKRHINSNIGKIYHKN